MTFGPFTTVIAPDAESTTTPQAFADACRDLQLDVVVAQNSDPAWSLASSWVWQQHPSYATSLVRIFNCPNASPPSRDAPL